MKKFKAEQMDLQSMSNVCGGDWDVTLKDSTIKYTKKSANAVKQDVDVTIEVSVDIEIEA